MTKIVLIGIGAGVAAAFLLAAGLFTFLLSGSFAAILLIYLAPLPILVVSLGWSHWAGLAASLCAGISLALALGPAFLWFIAGAALPAWWLSYLAMLARPAQRPTADGLEWYPVGRIVLWAAVIGSLLVVASIPFIGDDPDTFHATLRDAIGAALGAGQGSSATPEQGSTLDPDILARLAPPTLATVATAVQIINLWLAARIVKIFGQLRRPWPELPALGFPPLASAFLAAAVVGIFLPGFFGIIGGIFAASLTLAYTILGMAVLHVITRGLDGRPFLLALFYAVFVIFTWPLMIVASGLGLADMAFDLRGRAARKIGPPTLRI